MEQIISVLLKATGAGQFSSQMAQMASAANVTQRAVQGMQSVITGIKMAVVGAIGGVSIGAVTQLGSSFENTQNKMAGFLSALGQAPDFNSALKLSAGVMKQIELSSAALPGEAEDYVRVFTTALPSVQKSLGGTMDEMVAFTNRIAAVGATFGIDSMQVANDLNRMVQVGRGGAGLDVRTFTSMLPFLQRVEGHANLTAEAFNKMNEQARAKLLQKGMASLGPMIDHAASSFDAIKGTAQSILKTMFRTSTAGLFDGLKNSLQRINSLLMDENGNLTAFAERIVDYGKRASAVIVRLADKAVTFLEDVFSNADKIPAVFERIESAVKGAAIAMITFNVAQAGRTIVRGLGVGAGGGVARGVAGVGQLATALGSGGALAVGLAATAAVAVVAGTAAYALSKDWEQFAPRFDEITTQFKTQVLPAFASAGTSIMTILDPFLKAVGKQSVKVLTTSVELLGFAAYSAADTVDSLSYLLNNMVKSSDLATQLAEAGQRQRDLEKTNYRYNMAQHLTQPWKMAADFDPAAAPSQAKRTAPAGRGGAKIHQDFRGSKFTISQKFEEGYDPDRVAIAFVNDLRKIGEFRLQSGLEPMFGVGG